MNRHGHVHTSCVGKFLLCWPSQCCMKRISDDCGKEGLVRDMIQAFCIRMS